MISWDQEPSYKYAKGDAITEVATGQDYTIVQAPDPDIRLADCDQPFYYYRAFDTTHPTWGISLTTLVRRADEIESDKFVKKAWPCYSKLTKE